MMSTENLTAATDRYIDSCREVAAGSDCPAVMLDMHARAVAYNLLDENPEVAVVSLAFVKAYREILNK